MKDPHDKAAEKQLKAKIAFHREYLINQSKALADYVELNGPGTSLGAILGEMVAQNNALILAQNRLTQLLLDRDGLFHTSGSGVQPARS